MGSTGGMRCFRRNAVSNIVSQHICHLITFYCVCLCVYACVVVPDHMSIVIYSFGSKQVIHPPTQTSINISPGLSNLQIARHESPLMGKQHSYFCSKFVSSTNCERFVTRFLMMSQNQVFLFYAVKCGAFSQYS